MIPTANEAAETDAEKEHLALIERNALAKGRHPRSPAGGQRSQSLRTARLRKALAARQLAGEVSVPLQELHLGEVLGRGLTGSIRAGQLAGRRVAVKMTSPANELDDVWLLLNEVAKYQRMAALQGRYIPHLAAHGWTDNGGAYFLAMSIVDGEQLTKVKVEGKRKVEVRRAAMAALAEIHAAGVVHDDVRAPNLMVRRRAAKGECQVALLDFGLSFFGDGRRHREQDFRALEKCFE